MKQHNVTTGAVTTSILEHCAIRRDRDGIHSRMELGEFSGEIVWTAGEDSPYRRIISVEGRVNYHNVNDTPPAGDWMIDDRVDGSVWCIIIPREA